MVKGKPAKFIGVDGESVNDKYVMLCASDGSYIENADGLDTFECFEFLLGLKAKHPGHTIVGFVFNYDINMILKSRYANDRGMMEQLWKDKEVCLVSDSIVYELKWIPTKFVTIRSNHTVDISDVYGFFQCSFLSALKDWNVPDIVPGALERIESGKADRATFQVSDMPEMREYCIAECMMLVELCERLQDSLRDAGLRITNWIGAGAVSQAMIKKYDVLKHHSPDYLLPEPMQEIALRAYYGGRFEMFRQGYFEQCSNYDIISAYPYECLNLPSLHGTWKQVSKYDPDEPFAVWLTSWDLEDKLPVMPFPYRWKGNIYYPTEGMGWYWANEVIAARLMHPSIKVIEGWVFTPDDANVIPFEFMLDIWAKRKAAKEQGKASQKSYKLGMNGMYGKLAQGMGWNGQPPRQRSFIWAGMITSNVRARLLSMMYAQEDNVISVATDGLFFENDPGFSIGDELGQLELNQVDEYYQISNGIYYSPNAKIRTRGHSPKELDWDVIINEWDEHKFGGVYEYPARRFVGLGQAVMRKDFSLWGTWLEETRQMIFAQWLRKWADEDELTQVIHDTFENPNCRWYAGQLEGIKLGEIYKPKQDIFSHQTPKDKELEDYLANWEMFDQPTLHMEG